MHEAVARAQRPSPREDARPRPARPPRRGAGGAVAACAPSTHRSSLRYPGSGRWGAGGRPVPASISRRALLALLRSTRSEPPAWVVQHRPEQPVLPRSGLSPDSGAGGGCVVGHAAVLGLVKPRAGITASAASSGQVSVRTRHAGYHTRRPVGGAPSTTPSRRSRRSPSSAPPRAHALLEGVERELHVVPAATYGPQSRTTPWSTESAPQALVPAPVSRRKCVFLRSALAPSCPPALACDRRGGNRQVPHRRRSGGYLLESTGYAKEREGASHVRQHSAE